MSKFNTNTNTQKNVVADSVNKAGGKAYSYSNAKQEIASVILSSMINGNSYYETEAARINRIIKMVAEGEDKEFLAKAMVYVRNEGNLRSVSHIMGSILAENVKGSNFLRSALVKSMVRPDDMTEMVALYNSRNGDKMVPNVLRRSMKDALETKWDEYQLKKYLGVSNGVKLRDVVKMAHPKPAVLVAKGKAKDADVFKRVIEGTLDNIATAQTVNAGSKGEDRAQNYYAMLSEGKLGYMAALKNLKNILESMTAFGAADKELMVDKLCGLLRNERACRKSMVLPFRFTQAYMMAKQIDMDRILNKKLLRAIEDGFILSAKNIPIVEGDEKIALMLDESGSMGGWNGEDMTQTTPFMLGKTMMASMMTGLDKDNVVGYLWADRAREISVDGRPFDFIQNTRTQGGGTDLGSAIAGLIKTKTFVDKLVIFTDMQQNAIGGSYWGSRSGSKEFKDMVADYRKINPNVKVLFWNLQGYGKDTPMKLNHDVLEVSGFSDKMLSVIPKMWKDKDALIREIEAIQL